MTPDTVLDDAGDMLALLDYRRRVGDLYWRVRELGTGPESRAVWVAERDRLFREHPQSALDHESREGFTGLGYFPYDPAWRLEPEVEPAPRAEGRRIAHSDQGATPFRRVAQVRLPGPGEEVTLPLYWLEGYGGGLFLPFRDGTSGEESYGGGRYLLDTVKGADLGERRGRLVLDFNFAYHPSCVYSDRWSCPLAPPESRVAIAIRAGERLA